MTGAATRTCHSVFRMAAPPVSWPARAPAFMGGPRHGSCTSSLRINLPGSPVDRHRSKKVETRGLSGLLAALSPVVTPSQPAAWTHVACSGSLPRATSYHPACSYPHWLRPRRHAKQQHLAQRPDVIRQARGPGIMTPPEGIRERTDNKRRAGCARYSRWRDMTCPEIGNGEPAARIDDTVPEDAHGHCDP